MTVYLLVRIGDDECEIQGYSTEELRDERYAMLGKWASVTGWERRSIVVDHAAVRVSLY